MLEEIKYINHLNETLFFDKPTLFIQTSDLHDFSWNVKSKNGRISGFERGVHSRSISIVIKGNTEECIKTANRLFDVMEKDTLVVKHGKLFVGDYYLKCYVNGSKKVEYIRKSGFLKVTLKIVTDASFWVKESKTTFGYGKGGIAGKNLDFNRDFPSDYASNMLGTELNNTNFVESNFLINIYGACENPLITIGGHVYEVSASIGANEYLTIDSINKTIILTHEDGTKENCFNLRNKDSYIFQKIPAGRSQVASNTVFKFDVVLLEERSEPKWT